MRSRIPSSRKGWLLTLAVAAFVLHGFTGGCYAQRLPATPAAEHLRLLESPPLPYSVVVTPWDSTTAARLGRNSEAYSKAAFQWLRSSRAFSSVRLGSPTDTDADFTATSTGAYCNTAVIPLWTGLTLGLLPTVFTDSTCREVVFHPISNGIRGTDSVLVRHHSGGRVIMGWAAVPTGALLDWTHGEATDHPRVSAHARLAILAQSARLAALRQP